MIVRCQCDHCQIMDREVECICCQEIIKICEKKQKVSEVENLKLRCITDNPGFKVLCLNRWELEAAWFQYRQQYGGDNTIPEHKQNRHIAYRQLVDGAGECWGKI